MTTETLHHQYRAGVAGQSSESSACLRRHVQDVPAVVGMRQLRAESVTGLTRLPPLDRRPGRQEFQPTDGYPAGVWPAALRHAALTPGLGPSRAQAGCRSPICRLRAVRTGRVTCFDTHDGIPAIASDAIRRYVLGGTPTSSVNRVLNVPSEEDPTAKQTSVTVMSPRRSNAIARSTRRVNRYAYGDSP